MVGNDQREKLKFQSSGGALGGIIGPGFDNTRASVGYTELYSVSLAEVLRIGRVPKVIDYLSLDVEGAEYYVMQSFPWDQYRIKVMTVERPKHELQKLLIDQGYIGIALLASFGETLWVQKSQLHSFDLAALSYFELPKKYEGYNYTVGSAFIEGAYYKIP